MAIVQRTPPGMDEPTTIMPTPKESDDAKKGFVENFVAITLSTRREGCGSENDARAAP